MIAQQFQDNENNSNNKTNRFIPCYTSKMKTQHKIELSNIEIYFPFTPYKTQINYMQKILHNLNQKFLLNEKYNAIAALESPIGTGKTLCLLCSTLAWVNDMRKTNSYKGKIIYTAKTYKRINHIIRELNKTCYRPKICTLFSPYDACINDKINNSKDDSIIYMKCYNISSCEFHNNYKKYIKNKSNNCINSEYLDIEELTNFLCNEKICPFYYEKDNIYNSDIILMPYEFLFDKKMQTILNIDINNNIIIIDESHNLPKFCQEINNISINIKNLEEIIEELNEFIKNQNNKLESNNNDNLDVNDIQCEIQSINKIINNINNNNLKILKGEVYPDKGLLLTNKEFLSLFLAKSNYLKKKIEENNKNKINDKKYELEYVTLDNINKHIMLLKKIRKLININFQRKSTLSILISLLEKINHFYIHQNDNIIDSFQFFLSYINKENNDGLSSMRNLNIFCFDPSLSFKELIDKKPYGIFLISDTLAPLDIFEKEFKVKFDIKLENEHIIQNNQFKFNIIQSTTLNSEKIDFNLDNIQRSNTNMIIALGNTLLSLCHTNDKGSILVYFPSIAYLNQCNLIWKENNIIEKLQVLNDIYYSQKHLKKKSIVNDKKCIYFVVFNKNMSPEETFFIEAKITMVICLGMPYHEEYLFNDKIQLKMKYLDNNIGNNKTDKDNNKIKDEITGEKWFEKNYICIINRFLGKSLNYMSGYGSLICIDKRYLSFFNNELFSLYLRNNCEIINIENNTFFDSLKSFNDKITNQTNIGFSFFNDTTNDENRKGKPIKYIDEDEDSENYYFKKNYKTKIFNFKKEYNQKYEVMNNTKKLEELVLNSNKFNKLLDLPNLNTTNKKSKDFLQRKTNKKKEEISDNDENNINLKYKKLKKEEDEAYKNLLFKYKVCHSNNNNFQNFSDKCNEGNNNIFKDTENENIIINKESGNNQNNINNNICDGMEFKPNLEILEQLNNNIYTSETKEEYECPICFKISDKNPDLIYSISKCHHILCNICWSGWLSQKLECPLCKAKTRPKTLKKIIFSQ